MLLFCLNLLAYVFHFFYLVSFFVILFWNRMEEDYLDEMDEVEEFFDRDHFKRLNYSGPNNSRCACKHCGYASDTKRNETITLSNHLSKEWFQIAKIVSFQHALSSAGKDACRKACARMIVIDKLPFSHIEGEGLESIVILLIPSLIHCLIEQFLEMCGNCILMRKKKLKNMFLKKANGFFTTDTRNSIQNNCYMTLRTHYIDGSWRLHKGNFKLLFCPKSKRWDN